jgi:hypothetical protein
VTVRRAGSLARIARSIATGVIAAVGTCLANEDCTGNGRAFADERAPRFTGR